VTTTLRRLKLCSLPCLLLLCLTLPHLGQGDFRRDTGRYAAVGHYMWSGGHPGVPYLNPKTPYFNKPPLALSIHGLFLKTFGISLVNARLPSVLAALGIVILTMAAARQIGTRAEALASGFILASTPEFVRRSREISLDMWQLLFIMAAVVLILTGLRRGNKWWIATAGVPLGLALLCKPLVALLVIPIAVGWCLWSKKTNFIPWLLLGALPIALLVALPWHWHMYSLFGKPFLNQYFGKEVLDRARGLILKQPVYYYVLESLRTYWPWMLLLVYAIVYRFQRTEHSREARRDLVLLGLWWVAVMFVALSIFPDKKPNYALPLFPMLSWVVGAGVCRLPWHKLRAWYQLELRWLAPALTGILLIVSIAPIQFQKGPDKHWASVLKWVSQNTAGSVFEAGLDYNDMCYFYLKTGQWLRRWPQELDANTMAGIFLLTRTNRTSEFLKDGLFHPAISAGSFVVLAHSVPAKNSEAE